MAQEPDDPSVNMDENDISIFRRVLPSARQSRGRSIAHILYDRSIHGPQKVGGVKKSVDRHNSGALAQASPSSVILPTQTGTNGEKDSDDTDSLSEILGDDSLSNENGPMRNGNGVEAPLSGMLDNNMNGQAPPAPAPTSPCHRNPSSAASCN